MQAQKNITPRELFLGFSSVGLRGFGGVMPFVYEEVVEKRAWISEQDFVELIGLGQLLPGANVTNFAAMFGYRVAGWRGVVASIGGLLGPPAILILGLCYLYQKYSFVSAVQGALHGIMAVATALVFVTGFKMMRSQSGHLSSILLGTAALLAVGFFHVPLIVVLLIVGPLSLFFEWRRYE